MRYSATQLRRQSLNSSPDPETYSDHIKHLLAPVLRKAKMVADATFHRFSGNVDDKSHVKGQRTQTIEPLAAEHPFTYSEVKSLIHPASMSLCLLDRDFLLSAADAEVLHRLFGKNTVVGDRRDSRNLLKIIEPYLADAKKKDVEKYFRYLFSVDADENIVRRKNPLRCFTITALNQDRGSSTSHYEFNFKPIVRSGSVGKVLVSIEDISKAMAMEYSISTLKKKDQNSIEKLSSISSMLQFEKELIVDFLLSTTNSLKTVKKLVEKKYSSAGEKEEKFDEIFRIAHQVKGDAAALGFKFLAKETHNFESVLDDLKFRAENGNVRNDLNALVDPLKKMIDSLVNIRGLMNHLSDSEWDQDCVREELNAEQAIVKKMESLALKMTEGSKKCVKIVDDFSSTKLAEATRGGIQDMLVQLVRNAIIHGIEEPKVRRAYAKTPYGCIHISSRRTSKGLVISVRDDGAGIDPWKIRNAALRSGKYAKDCVAGWNDADIFELIKAPGFSTAESLSRHAGRGVGLDVIDAKTKKLGGKLSISSKKNIFTQFTIVIPA